MKILLVGGSKSGKSGLAQRLCVRLAADAPMIYWATMEPVDGEDRARIARGLGLQHGRVRPSAGARRTAGEGLRAV